MKNKSLGWFFAIKNNHTNNTMVTCDCRLTEDNEQNASPEPKSEDSDSDSKNSARQHCKALILLHSKCFTMSLFSALHSELFIHAADVQAAMDQCEEHVYEIDITEYILVGDITF